MNENEKSLELAKLMGWNSSFGGTKHVLQTLKHYCDSTEVLSQFASILLKFPEVMNNLSTSVRCSETTNRDVSIMRIKPTQENILDEILKMNDVQYEGQHV